MILENVQIMIYIFLKKSQHNSIMISTRLLTQIMTIDH